LATATLKNILNDFGVHLNTLNLFLFFAKIMFTWWNPSAIYWPSSNRKTPHTTNEPIDTMTPNTRLKLHELFMSLNCDLEIGLATCIAESLKTSAAVIFAEYEAWQIA